MWQRLLSGMRLTSPSESLRGQFEITGHPSLNSGITGHAHKMEILEWTHISTTADSGITGKRQPRRRINKRVRFGRCRCNHAAKRKEVGGWRAIARVVRS
jgi:hypothetical protein